jgi:sugar phosphate isomerase/epimerase
MIYTGFTVQHYKGLPPSMIVGWMRSMGVKFIEINTNTLADLPALLPKIKTIKTAFHLPLIHEQGWDLSTPHSQNKTDRLLETLTKNRETLNIQHVICHPPEPEEMKNSQPVSFDLLLDNLSRLNIPIYLENVPTIDPEHFAELYEKASVRLGSLIQGICYDAAHYLISGIDPLKAYENHSHLIKTVHLSDCTDKSDAHLPFGQGILPVDEILNLIKKSSFKGFITLEIKPKSLYDLDDYLNSYLKTIKMFNPWQYWITRFRILILTPILRRLLA